MDNQPDLVLTAATELAELAAEFCELIDERAQYSAVELLKRVHPLLPRLYSVGLALAGYDHDLFEEPAEDLDAGDEDEDEDEPYDIDAVAAEESKDRLPMEHWWVLFRSLEAQLGKMDAYAEVFDPFAEPQQAPVTGTLSDDLADIYHDLAEGLVKWRRGERTEAAERWGESFAIHWNEHATGALRAINTLAYVYYWDLSRYQA